MNLFREWELNIRTNVTISQHIICKFFVLVHSLHCVPKHKPSFNAYTIYKFAELIHSLRSAVIRRKTCPPNYLQEKDKYQRKTPRFQLTFNSATLSMFTSNLCPPNYILHKSHHSGKPGKKVEDISLDKYYFRIHMSILMIVLTNLN